SRSGDEAGNLCGADRAAGVGRADADGALRTVEIDAVLEIRRAGLRGRAEQQLGAIGNEVRRAAPDEGARAVVDLDGHRAREAAVAGPLHLIGQGAEVQGESGGVRGLKDAAGEVEVAAGTEPGQGVDLCDTTGERRRAAVGVVAIELSDAA